MTLRDANVTLRSILIFGLFRSGTTLLTDLLTRRGQSVVFSEPMLMDGWRQQADVIPATLEALGIRSVALPANKKSIGPADWFDSAVLPLLQGLQFWGFKEVHFNAAEALIRRYPPDFLLLTVRDPRDLFLSALDLINKLLLAFQGGRLLRDEAWIYARLLNDVRVLADIFIRHRGTLLRYEDQSESRGWPEEVSALLGETFAVEERVALPVADGGRKIDEAHKHGHGLSLDSVFRWSRVTAPRARAINYWLWRDLGPLYRGFGYGADPALGEIDRAAVAAIARPFTSTMARTISSPALFAKNHGHFFFALRAGRLYLASGLPPASAIVEMEPLLPALRCLVQGARYSPLAIAPGGNAMAFLDTRCPDGQVWEQASHVVFNHVLEFVPDWSLLLDAALAAGKTVMMTVFLADEIPPWWGGASPPLVDREQLFALVAAHSHDIEVSDRKTYGARLVVLTPR